MKHEVTFHYDKWERRHVYSPDDGATVYTIKKEYVDKGWIIELLLLSENSDTYVTSEVAWLDDLNKAKNFVRFLVHAKNEKRRLTNNAFRVKEGCVPRHTYGAYVRFD